MRVALGRLFIVLLCGFVTNAATAVLLSSTAPAQRFGYVAVELTGATPPLSHGIRIDIASSVGSDVFAVDYWPEAMINWVTVDAMLEHETKLRQRVPKRLPMAAVREQFSRGVLGTSSSPVKGVNFPSWAQRLEYDFVSGESHGAIGFPLRCFRGLRNHQTGPVGIVRLNQFGISGDLLVIPIWQGLLANILLFSLASYVFIFAFFDGRRILRRRRGLCPTCGYDLTGSTACPECGQGMPTPTT